MTVSEQERTLVTQMPESLRRKILRVMLDDDSTWDNACAKAEALLATGSVAFKEAVAKEAQSLYKSRHLTELNKAMKGMKEKWYGEGYDDGAKNETHFSVPCPRCGKDMNFTNFDSNWLTAKTILETAFKDWSHVNCK